MANFSLLDLFRTEAASQAELLSKGLIALEQDRSSATILESLMRAAHSLKGAARIVGLNGAVAVAHAMEDLFVAAQKGEVIVDGPRVDVLLAGVDLLNTIAASSEAEVSNWTPDCPDVTAFLAQLVNVAKSTGPVSQVPRPPVGPAQPEPMPVPPPPVAHAAALKPYLPADNAPLVPYVAAPASTVSAAAPVPLVPHAPQGPATGAPSNAVPAPAVAPNAGHEDRFLRITADHLNRLLGLAGESLVEARKLQPFGASLQRLRRMQQNLAKEIEVLQEALASVPLDEKTARRVGDLRGSMQECRTYLDDRVLEIDAFDRRFHNVSHRLYEKALACRMRPFADGTVPFPRMVRDVARSLGKEARLIIVGQDTQVDRDILERLEAPLTHMLRNAVDHALEMPEERIAVGKSPEGTIRLEARHSAGMLVISVRDDGRGIDAEAIRRSIVEKGLTNAETAARLREGEVFDFLFLPGFTMKNKVTEISGRGVGLDVVADMMKRLRGTVRVSTEKGNGSTFQMQLPLTLSVVRALVVEIAGEPYGLPLAALTHTLKLDRSAVITTEGRQHFDYLGQRIGVVAASQILGKAVPSSSGPDVCIVLLGDRTEYFGLVVDRFRGERELVVHPLDPRLGKIKDISAGALLEDGSPLLIVDTGDLLHSARKLAELGRLGPIEQTQAIVGVQRKRILVVDDSLTVRELERKLLENMGYVVELAVDGMDGWNALRSGEFDLVLTDVDMPRMDGIELLKLIRSDANLMSKPVMIVSYKDREEDRARGLDAGADYYLTKGSFHDDTLVEAVEELIGKA